LQAPPPPPLELDSPDELLDAVVDPFEAVPELLVLELLDDPCPPPAPELDPLICGMSLDTHPTVAPTAASAAHTRASLNQCIPISSLSRYSPATSSTPQS
jgi:hypothetical protein